MSFEFEVKVTVSGQERSTFGRASEINHSGIVVISPLELEPDVAIELEMADSLLYGQVVHSKPLSTSFQTAIIIRRVALGGTEIARILQRILLEELPDIPGLDSTEAHLD